MSETPHEAPDFAAWLQNQLDLAGWSQADFVRVSGLAGSAVHRYANGRARPDTKSARTIATALGLPVLDVVVAADLLTREEVGAGTRTPLRVEDLTDAEMLRELGRRLDRANMAER